jgi:two-component system phosphate regulon response regulator PhoB
MMETKILVIEDDQPLSEIVSYNLSQHGYQVSCASDGQSGFQMAVDLVPELILLDVMLPKLDGIEVCRRLRAHPKTLGCVIVMLTAKSEEADQLLGFSVGADDYVIKPFSVKVLLERIRAMLRRWHHETDPQVPLVSNALVLDRMRHQVTLHGEPLGLTPSEFRLLETLMREPGRAFDRKDLIELALGEDTVVLDRTIDVHIRSLRKKLGDHGGLIETIRGVGYRFNEPSRREQAVR